MSDHQESEVAPPHAQLMQMAAGYWTSKSIYAAAKLGIAERLGETGKSANELAMETGTHAPSLYRFLRALAGMGILTEGSDQTFSLTSLGEALKPGAPGCAHATVLTLIGDPLGKCWDHLLYSLETGKTGQEKAHGLPLFEYLSNHPDEASLFSETMVGFHGAEPPAVAAAYDFSQFKSIVDVGGATGHMLANVLKLHPQPRGVLFDLPHVVRDAPALLQSHGLHERIDIESGSFFESVPVGHDAYLLSHIIHDWNEDQCVSILRNCRDAINANGRLLIVEMVLPVGDTPHPGKMLDIMMLVGPGGQERTEDEYATLLSKANFRLTNVVSTVSDVSVVEAVPT